MRRLLCYFLHRRFRIIVQSGALPWPLELIDPLFVWHCADCDRGGGRLGARIMSPAYGF